MNGKVVGLFIAATALIGGIGMYVLQVYVFFDEVPAEDVTLRMTSVATGQPEPIQVDDVQAIDGTSSPLKFRACFTTPHDHAMLTETYVVLDKPVPLTAPDWFDCFDADAIGAALQAEQAIAYMGEAEIKDGVDRVIAVFDDGRGFAWHQLNEKYAD